MSVYRRISRVCLGALAGLAVGCVGDAIVTDLTARSLASAIGRSAGMAAGSVAVDGWGGTVTLRQVVVAHGRSRIAVDRIVLALRNPRLFAFVTPGLAADGRLHAENIQVDGSFGHLRIPALDAIGTELTAPELVRLLDPESLTAFRDRLRGARAAAIRIPHLDLDWGAGAAKRRLSLDAVEFDGLADGLVASVRASRLAQGSDATTADISAGRLTIEALNLDLLARVVAGDAGRPTGRTRAWANASLADLRLGADKRVLIDEIALRDVRLRPLDIGLAELAETLQTTTPPSELTNATLAIKALRSVSVKALEVHNLRGVERPGAAASFALGLARISYADGVFDEVRFERLDGIKGAFKIAVVAYSQIDLRPALDKLPAFWSGKLKLDDLNVMALLPTVQKAHIGGLESFLPPLAGVVAGRVRPFTIGSYRLERSNAPNGIPDALTVSLEHVAFALDLDAGGHKDEAYVHLQELGYESVDLSIHISLIWDQRAEVLNIDGIDIDLADAITLSMHGKLIDFGPDLYDDSKAVAQAAVLKIKLRQLGLRIEDHGLVAREVRFAAGRLGVSTAWFQVAYGGFLDIVFETALPGEAAMRLLGRAAAAFVAKPQALDITLEANRPLGVADAPLFKDPAALLRRVQLRATNGP